MKKILFIAILISIANPLFARSKTTCEKELFSQLDTNYNHVVELDEFNRLYKIVFGDIKKSCTEALEIVKKQKAPDPLLGKVNTAPSPHFSPPPKHPSEPNMPPATKLAPSRYVD